MGRLRKLEQFGSSESEMTPLNPRRRDSNESGSSSARTNSYGSFIPSYFTFFRNSLRRSRSLQVGNRKQVQEHLDIILMRVSANVIDRSMFHVSIGSFEFISKHWMINYVTSNTVWWMINCVVCFNLNTILCWLEWPYHCNLYVSPQSNRMKYYEPHHAHCHLILYHKIALFKKQLMSSNKV